MIGFLLNMMAGPMIVLGICGTAICMLWMKCRNVRCCKRLIRWIEGHGYEDAWLTIVVHEVKTQVQDPITVRCCCGSNAVNTSHQPPTSRGVFQEGLVLLIPEGEDDVSFELLASQDVIAKLNLSFSKHIMQNNILERTLKMKSKRKGISNVTISLTLVPQIEEGGVDPEDPPEAYDVDWLVKRQMEKLKHEIADEENVDEEGMSDMHLLLKVTHGPLDMLSGMGNREHCYFAVLSPPNYERWAFGVWFEKKPQFEQIETKAQSVDSGVVQAGQNPDIWIDMKRVHSVMADPDQVSTFAIKYEPKKGFHEEQRFRRIEKSRDVWVDSLQKLIHMVHEQRRAEKPDKTQAKKRKEIEEKSQSSGAEASAKSSAFPTKSAPSASSSASRQMAAVATAGAAASSLRSATLKKTSSKK